MSTFDYRAVLDEIENEPTASGSIGLRVLPIVAATIAVLSFGVVVWFAYSEGIRLSRAPVQTDGAPEFIQATPTKTRPVADAGSSYPESDAGGTEVIGGVRQDELSSLSRQDTPQSDSWGSRGAASSSDESIYDLLRSDQDRGEQEQPTSRSLLTEDAADPMSDPTSPIALRAELPSGGLRQPALPSVTEIDEAGSERLGLNPSPPDPLLRDSSDPVQQRGRVLGLANVGSQDSVADDPLLKEGVAVANSSAPLEQVSARLLDASWRVQLAALRSEEDAEAFWRGVSSEALSETVGRKQHQIVGVQIPERGTYYRLRAGPFDSREAASAACAQLKSRDLDCIVVRPGA